VPVKRILIGDIHGCYDELQALLDIAGLSGDDEIIALGDIVDRGPATPQVLEFFQTQPNARSIMGNHERKHLRSFRGETKAARSQIISRAQLGKNYPAWLKFIEVFPRGLELDEAILVHGFWEPGKSLTQQNDMVIIGTMGGEKIVTKACGDKWYEHYDGDKPLIVGHHDYLRNGQPLIFTTKYFAWIQAVAQARRLLGSSCPIFASSPFRVAPTIGGKQCLPIALRFHHNPSSSGQPTMISF